MKKLFSKILALSVVATMMSTSVFAAETVDLTPVELSNVTGVSEYSIYLDEDGNDLPVYLCEDYTEINFVDDIGWISVYYFYDYDNLVDIGPYTVDENEQVIADFDVTINITNEELISLPLVEFYEGVYAEEIEINDDTQVSLEQGSCITIGYQGIYVVDITYADGLTYDYFTFVVTDTDGVNSYEASEEVTEAVTEEVTEEVTEIITGIAKSSTCSVIVDGEEIAFEAYEINGNNYFKLRDIAAVSNGSEKQFEVTWDGDLNAIGLISGQSYTEVSGELATGDGTDKEYKTTTAEIYKDSELVDFEAYEINDNNYFKLRDVCKAFDIGVTWDDATQTIGIDTSISYQD